MDTLGKKRAGAAGVASAKKKAAVLGIALGLCLAADAQASPDKMLSVRAEMLWGGGSGVGGAIEGALFTDNGLFLSLQGQGGGVYGGGLANFGWHFDNSQNLGQAVGFSGGFQNVALKTFVKNENNNATVDTLKESHSGFGGVFWKLLIGKKGMLDVTNRVLLGTSKTFDYENYAKPPKEESGFNLTYSLGVGYAFGNRKRAVIEEPVPEPVVVEIPTFTVSASVSPKDAGSVEPSGKITVEKGGDLELVFSVNDGFTLEKVLVDSEPVEIAQDEDKYRYALREISQDVSVRAVFEKVVKIEISKVASVQEGIAFEVGTAVLSPTSRKTLEGLYLTLAENSDTRVEVAGHTDISGGYDYNIALSKKRAQAVVDYFVGKGIAADRLVSVGHGPDKPIADNATQAGREKNRRVEIRTIE